MTYWKCALAFLFAPLVIAQNPTVFSGGIVNVASYAVAGQPNGSIARGSVVVIFGTNMGPTALLQASTYPLPTSLGGTSVKVTSGATALDAIMLYTSAGQVAAIVPSAMPVGPATLVVSIGGKSSAPAAFTVVANSFGIFAANQAGSGPGVITDGASNVFGLTTAANPGQVVIIWGTGLGPVTGNEAGGALPGDMPGVPVEVYVGGQLATVNYRGRSGCCAGIDQISFTVPAVFGCRVPVTLKINTVISNYATMAIAPTGTRTCSDPGGPSASDLQRFAANGASVARVTLNRNTTSLPFPAGLPGTTIDREDVATATFFKYSAAQLGTARDPFNTPVVGSCTVYALSGVSASTRTYGDSFLPGDPIAATSLDAGASIAVSGPGGAKTLLKSRDSIHPVGSPAYYSGYLTTLAQEDKGYVEPSVAVGVSGPGGKDVGAFQASIAVPPVLTWSNASAISKITRASGQLITWTGGDPNGVVTINGTSLLGTGTNIAGSSFTCVAKVSDGQFTVPAAVLLALPVNASNSNIVGYQYGRLAVGTSSTLKGFTATGVDFSSMFVTMAAEKLVDFQ